MSLLCALNLHKFEWPPHGRKYPGAYHKYYVMCSRGSCGAREVLVCSADDDHWVEKHPEPEPER